MKNTKPGVKLVIGVVAALLVVQALNTFFRQRHGYFECRDTGNNPTYFFEFQRSFFTLHGTCPKTGAFDPFAVKVGAAGIDECLRIFNLVKSQGLVCEAVPAPP